MPRPSGWSSTEGVYGGLAGPTYETPAEVRMMRTLGADLVGDVTVLEVIAARHLGVRCACISLAANPGAGMVAELLDHEEVLAAGARRGRAPRAPLRAGAGRPGAHDVGSRTAMSELDEQIATGVASSRSWRGRASSSTRTPFRTTAHRARCTRAGTSARPRSWRRRSGSCACRAALLGIRGHGKVMFLDLADGHGKLQLFVRRPQLPEAAQRLLDNLDLGDLVGAGGTLFRTRPASCPSTSTS